MRQAAGRTLFGDYAPARFHGVLIALCVLSVVAQTSILGEKILNRIQTVYGAEARQRAVDWDMLMLSLHGQPIREQLNAVNHFFNRVVFTSDENHWGARDYWATPVEFLGTNGGDCEDFALAKYFTLQRVGVPMERMRLTYVKALELGQAHMVLTYFETPGSEPLVLDNLTDEIMPASQRRDLEPVYSFNGDGLWLAKLRGLGERLGTSSRIGKWTALLQRMGRLGQVGR